MLETESVDVNHAPGATVTVVNLSDVHDARWAGTAFLPPHARLPLETGVRNDVYVLKGDLIEQTTRHTDGTFLSRFEGTDLQAGPRGASLFMYRDRRATNSRHETVNERDLEWHRGSVDGMQVAPLFGLHHRLMLVSWMPGTRVHAHSHPWGEEIFVLEGELCDQHGRHQKGTWLRFHPGTAHAPYAEVKTRILLRNGHLR